MVFVVKALMLEHGGVIYICVRLYFYARLLIIFNPTVRNLSVVT